MGFAFVEFTQHAHALQCLTKLNNNPKIFTDDKVVVSGIFDTRLRFSFSGRSLNSRWKIALH